MATWKTDDHVIETLANQLLHNATTRDPDLDGESGGTTLEDVPLMADILREAMMKSIEDVEKRFTVYSRKCQKLQQSGTVNPKKIQKAVTYMENYLMQKFKEKEPFIIEFDNNGNGADYHRQALRNCRVRLLQDLDLRDGKVLDRLLEDDVMSVADKDSIIRKQTIRSQNEEFFRYIEGRVTSEEFHRSLIPAMKSNHAHLASDLLKEEDILDESDAYSKCVVCKVFNTVELKRLANPLLELKAIPSALHADLRSASISNSQKWAELKKADVPHEVIIQALKRKYPDFYYEFQKTNRRLECFCTSRSLVSAPFPMTPSLSDVTQTQQDGPGDIAQIDDLMKSYLGTHSDDSELEYRMTARPRGVCLIINNVEFEDNTEARMANPRLGNRVGSNIDVKRLEKIFSKLEFKVQISTNLTDSELVTTAVDMAGQDHSKFDAFVCCVLSHCAKDVVYGTNCRTVRLSEITSPFRASSCQTLAGKPKMFFIQGAQGPTRMKGFKVDDSGIDDNSASSSLSSGNHNRQANSSHVMGDIEANIIPDEADFLLGYSTFPGYVSYRSRELGSWYIIKLAETLEKQADRHDLLSCLLMVNEEIAKGNAFMGDGVFKQVPAPLFTLRRKVHLTYDPAWSESLSFQNQETSPDRGGNSVIYSRNTRDEQ